MVVGNDAAADELARAAMMPFALGKSVVRLREGEAVAEMLPQALRETVPHLPPGTRALVCTDGVCRAPVENVEELGRVVREAVIG